MKHEKTFNAISKLKDVEMELHRLKNALEMANSALDAQRTWVGLTDEERQDIALEVPIDAVFITESKLKEKNS